MRSCRCPIELSKGGTLLLLIPELVALLAWITCNTTEIPLKTSAELFDAGFLCLYGTKEGLASCHIATSYPNPRTLARSSK